MSRFTARSYRDVGSHIIWQLSRESDRDLVEGSEGLRSEIGVASPRGGGSQDCKTVDRRLRRLHEALVDRGSVRRVRCGSEALEVSVGGATGAGGCGGRDVRQRGWAAVWVVEAGGTVGGHRGLEGLLEHSLVLAGAPRRECHNPGNQPLIDCLDVDHQLPVVCRQTRLRECSDPTPQRSPGDAEVVFETPARGGQDDTTIGQR